MQFIFSQQRCISCSASKSPSSLPAVLQCLCVCGLSRTLTVSLWLPEREGFLVRACSSSVCVCVCGLTKRLPGSLRLPEREGFLACSSSLCKRYRSWLSAAVISFDLLVSVPPDSERDTHPPLSGTESWWQERSHISGGRKRGCYGYKSNLAKKHLPTR